MDGATLWRTTYLGIDKRIHIQSMGWLQPRNCSHCRCPLLHGLASCGGGQQDRCRWMAMIGGWRDLERPRGGHDNTRQNKTSNGPHHLVDTHSMVRSHGIRSSQFPFDRIGVSCVTYAMPMPAFPCARDDIHLQAPTSLRLSHGTVDGGQCKVTVTAG